MRHITLSFLLAVSLSFSTAVIAGDTCPPGVTCVNVTGTNVDWTRYGWAVSGYSLYGMASVPTLYGGNWTNGTPVPPSKETDDQKNKKACEQKLLNLKAVLSSCREIYANTYADAIKGCPSITYGVNAGYSQGNISVGGNASMSSGCERDKAAIRDVGYEGCQGSYDRMAAALGPCS